MRLHRDGDGYGESVFLYTIDRCCIYLVAVQRAKDYLYGERNADDNDCYLVQHETRSR